MTSVTEQPTARNRKPVERRVADGAAVLGGLCTLAACGLIARDGDVGPLEVEVFRLVNGLPDALTPVLHGVQYLGVLVVGPIVGLGALALRRYRLGAAALLVTAGKLVSERIVWTLVVRSRPGTSIADAIVRGTTPASGQSFVSGHVVLTTGLAWVLTPYLRGRWRILPGLVAAVVAFARLYLGAHAPLDVLGGAGLGAALGGAANLIVGVPERDAAGSVRGNQGGDRGVVRE